MIPSPSPEPTGPAQPAEAAQPAGLAQLSGLRWRVGRVRGASQADLGAILEMRRSALAELQTLRGASLYAEREARPPTAEDLQAAQADPDRAVWVGCIDEAAVGYLLAHVESLRGGSVLGVVEAIYVEPQARAVGVGEALMDTALAWFRRRGCAGVDALALPGARLTKNFFEESGFTSRLLVMHHRFDHDAAEEPGADQA